MGLISRELWAFVNEQSWMLSRMFDSLRIPPAICLIFPQRMFIFKHLIIVCDFWKAWKGVWCFYHGRRFSSSQTGKNHQVVTKLRSQLEKADIERDFKRRLAEKPRKIFEYSPSTRHHRMNFRRNNFHAAFCRIKPIPSKSSEPLRARGLAFRLRLGRTRALGPRTTHWGIVLFQWNGTADQFHGFFMLPSLRHIGPLECRQWRLHPKKEYNLNTFAHSFAHRYHH